MHGEKSFRHFSLFVTNLGWWDHHDLLKVVQTHVGSGFSMHNNTEKLGKSTIIDFANCTCFGSGTNQLLGFAACLWGNEFGFSWFLFL